MSEHRCDVRAEARLLEPGDLPNVPPRGWPARRGHHHPPRADAGRDRRPVGAAGATRRSPGPPRDCRVCAASAAEVARHHQVTVQRRLR